MRNDELVTYTVQFVSRYPGTNCFPDYLQCLSCDTAGHTDFFNRFGAFNIAGSDDFGT